MNANIPLISRQILFSNPQKALVKISPNGKYLTHLAPHHNVLNIYIQTLGSKTPPQPLTQDQGPGIQSYSWAYDNDHLLYVQDKDGDENWCLFKLNIHTKKITALTDEKKVQVKILGISHKHPHLIVVGLNNRKPEYHDLYQINLLTGTKEKILENDEFGDFLIDDDLHIRLTCKTTDSGEIDWFVRKETKWEKFRSFNAEDQANSGPLNFSKNGDQLYWLDSTGQDLAALTLTDLDSKKTTYLAHPQKTDFSSAVFHPTENVPLWVGETYLKPQKKFLDQAYEADFKHLESIRPGSIPLLTSSTLDFNQWIVAYYSDTGPVYYYLYDRATKKTEYLFSQRPQLENLSLSPMIPLEIESRDGLTLVSYLTLPQGLTLETAHHLPTVLLVHGGPQSRDTWGYDAQHQWLSNRGYAVLSVNYRGSDGFGKKFISAGDKQSGHKMHDDLIDAVNWLIQKKISDPAKIAIQGGSYGGYATLVGLTMTPDVFACGIDLVGPSNLLTLLNSIPPYWKPYLATIIKKYGDPRTEEGQKLLKERSPITYVDRIKKPLLIGHGANDPRVKQAESDQIVEAMKQKNIPVTYVLYPDEGHGFVKPENRISFYATVEKFLAQFLGGRFEPIGDDYKGASLQIKADTLNLHSVISEKRV
ncbi:MAG: alpha/beta fold hydrolase [Alphaproteobacteria bacterium]